MSHISHFSYMGTLQGTTLSQAWNSGVQVGDVENNQRPIWKSEPLGGEFWRVAWTDCGGQALTTQLYRPELVLKGHGNLATNTSLIGGIVLTREYDRTLGE